MPAPAPLVETDRLILRPPAPEDYEAFAAYGADAVAMEFVGGLMSRSMAWRNLCTITGAWTIRGFSMFSVLEKSTGRWVGRLGPWMPEDWPGTEVGWGIVRDCWGKGYATEGSAAAIDWVFEALGWREVIHCIDPANVNSRKVAERLGSTILRQTRLPPPFEHVVVDVWGQSREQWMARRGR